MGESRTTLDQQLQHYVCACLLHPSAIESFSNAAQIATDRTFLALLRFLSAVGASTRLVLSKFRQWLPVNRRVLNEKACVVTLAGPGPPPVAVRSYPCKTDLHNS